MTKTAHTFASLIIGCWLIAFPFAGDGQQISPALEPSANQIISTLSDGHDKVQFTLLAPAADLDQYRNGPFDAPVNTCTNWVNGNAGEQNSHYIEGWSIPYRCVMTDLPLNTSITLTLGYDIRNSGKNALDYLTYYHRMLPHDNYCDQTHNMPECVTPAAGIFSTFPIPAPSSVGSPVPGMPTASFNNLPASERIMVLYGGTITSIAYNTQGDLNANQSETRIDVTLTVTETTATLAWGGHIASRLDWGEGNSAGGISGSPYHMRLIDWNLNNLGNQDRSLSAGAVGPPCSIMGPDNVCAGSTQQYCVTNQAGIAYNWTVSGGGAVIVGSNTGNCVEIQAGDGDYSVMVSLSTNDGYCVDCSMSVVVEPIGVCVIDGNSVVCPGASSQHCASPGGTSWSWSVSGGASIVGPADQECVTVSAVNDCDSSYTLTLSMGDPDCGSLCTKTVLIRDNTSPLVTCPVDTTVACTNLIPPVNIDAPTVSDNCGGSVTVSFVSHAIYNQLCPEKYLLVRTYNATDACGNSATCSQKIVVFDQTPPSITCLSDTTVSCASDVPAADPNAVVVSDNCGGMVTTTHVGDVISNQSCPDNYTITRTYMATDACGNTATCTQVISVNDEIAPDITCPANTSVSCASDVPAADPDAVVVSDNCGGMVTTTHAGDVISNQSCPDNFTLTRTYMATDVCGNTATCTQVITVNDEVAPTITCPANTSVSCASDVPAPYPDAVVVSDNCGGMVITTHAGDEISNQSCPDNYTITRTYIATDVCGNTATCTQVITVNDEIGPDITCPANTSVSCTSDVPAPDPDAVVVSDNCGGTVTVTHAGDEISNQSCPDNYTLTRTYMATDACGNTATCTQVITVNDEVAPTITCPANTSVSCTSDVPAPDPDAVVVSDNCGGTVTVTHVGDVISNQSCPENYTLTRTYMATDACGNTATCTQVITVNDQTGPDMTCPDDITVSCAFEVPAADPNAVIASDNCGGVVTVMHLGDEISNQTCADRYTLTRTYQGTDACGNTATCTQVITVNDQTGPDMTCPDDITVSCATEVPAADPDAVVVSDNCSGTVTTTHVGDVISNQSCPDNFTLTRTYMATDVCGNTATCTQVITVNDQIAPVITCPDNITVACANQVPAPNLNDLIVSDNCGGMITKSHVGDVISNQICPDNFTLTRTYMATDACGNTATCTQVITVNDQLTPAGYFIVNGDPDAEEVKEACDEAALVLDRADFDPGQPLTVMLLVGGTAASGADYSPILTSYTIPAGQDQLIIPISIVTDMLAEGPETITVSLVGSCSCDGTKDTLTILDYVPMMDTTTVVATCTSGAGATLTANPMGGTAPFDFFWSTNETAQSIFVNPLVNTSYSVTIVDACKDTAVHLFNVMVLQLTEITENVSFCPGESVVVNGVTYNQPGTVKDTLPGMNGACDTVATYVLQLLPQVSFTDTIAFCPGDTVFINGTPYTSPGTVMDTLPGSAGFCDTLATYVLVSLLPAPSVVTLTCPADIIVDTDPALVTYAPPVASTDCPCPGISLELTEGLPSGSVFPVGTTKVCYEAKDSCGNTASCCFNVTVIIPPEEPCDEATNGCIKFELITITEDAVGNHIYRLRVTNNCSNKLMYAAFSLPSGVVAVSPPNNSVYTAPSGREYNVRNPNFSPFYSIRFYSSVVGIANGASDVFEYVLPIYAYPQHVHAIVRLEPKIFNEVYLECVEDGNPKPVQEKVGQAGDRKPLHISPNPTTGLLCADLSYWMGEEMKIQVFDSRGQQIHLQTLTGGAVRQEITLPEELPGGLYFLEMITENGARQTARFVLHR